LNSVFANAASWSNFLRTFLLETKYSWKKRLRSNGSFISFDFVASALPIVHCDLQFQFVSRKKWIHSNLIFCLIFGGKEFLTWFVEKKLIQLFLTQNLNISVALIVASFMTKREVGRIYLAKPAFGKLALNAQLFRLWLTSRIQCSSRYNTADQPACCFINHSLSLSVGRQLEIILVC